MNNCRHLGGRGARLARARKGCSSVLCLRGRLESLGGGGGNCPPAPPIGSG